MPTLEYIIVNAVSGAAEITVTDRELAVSELARMNREAETGERAAYDDGQGGTVPAQRLVSVNAGHLLASDPRDPMRAEDVGRLLHRGEPVGYELVIREVPTEDELREQAEQAQRDAERAQRDADAAMIERLRAAGLVIG